jgi:tetratricopeptide (TPR) repeat protein
MGQKTTANYWFQRGNKSLKLGQYKIACRAYKNAVKIDPQNADAWNNIGICCYALVHHNTSFEL